MGLAPGSWPNSDTLLLVTAADARAGDRYAMANGDAPEALMWRAAGHLVRHIIAPARSGYGLRVVIVAGKGNNGGDGFTAALRLTREQGAHVVVVALDGVDVALSREAEAYRSQWLTQGGQVITDVTAAKTAIRRAHVVVDAILGTGASGPLRGLAAVAVGLLAFAKSAGVHLVACDLPTGVDADSGAVAPNTVKADRTITFGAVKRGHMLAPGASYCGEVTVASLGHHWDRFLHNLGSDPAQPPFTALTGRGACPAPYAPEDDKWSRGRVAVIGGVTGMAGAASLAAMGALTAGAGLVSVYASDAVAAEIAGHVDASVMVRRVALADTAPSGLVTAAWLETADLGVHADVIVAGPGFGVAPEVAATVKVLLASAARLVLDADALNVFRHDPHALQAHAGQLVLTPHRKELARIGGGVDGDDAWANRVTRVPTLAQKLNATIVAKGPATLIAAPDGRVWVTPVGSAAAGTGGSGDLLSGIIAAAVARADDVPLAVAQAVWWHALAAQHAGERAHGRATAESLRTELPHVFHALATGSTTL